MSNFSIGFNENSVARSRASMLILCLQPRPQKHKKIRNILKIQFFVHIHSQSSSIFRWFHREALGCVGNAPSALRTSLVQTLRLFHAPKTSYVVLA